MINSLEHLDDFRRRRRAAWEGNVDFWLNGPLRHVDDVGDYIVRRVVSLCDQEAESPPVIVDMGFGNAWLLRELMRRDIRMSYVGLDSMEPFVERAAKAFENTANAAFFLADVETTLNLPICADVVVNAFNFFELCDLAQAMSNVSRHLRFGGRLFMSTIDKTYLILALSENNVDFYKNLAAYQNLPGTKYGFQRIDLGAHVSEILEYPSVLYSTQDFIEAASGHGLRFINYAEHPFTSKLVPKIYCHLEFERVSS